jgi:hypothetical protein
VVPTLAIIGAVFAVFAVMLHRARKKRGLLSLTEATALPMSTFSKLEGMLRPNLSDLGLSADPQKVSFGVVDVDKHSLSKYTNNNDSGQKETVFFTTQEQKYVYTLDVLPATAALPPGGSCQVTLTLTMLCTTRLQASLAVSRDRADYSTIYVTAEGGPSGKLNWEDLQMGEVIGEGGSGVVRKGVWRGVDVAIKELRYVLFEEMLADLQKEIELLQSLRSPHVITFYGTACLDMRMCMVIELAPLGHLKGLIITKPELFTLPLQVKVALDIARGMALLHNNAILHRDVKCENVLMFSTNPKAAVCGKLSDFGTSRATSDHDAAASYTKGVGTPVYMAPELLERKPYSSAVDVYAFGIVLWEIVNKAEPYQGFHDQFEIIKFVCEGNRLLVDPQHPLAKLTTQCWDQEPKLRPSFNEITAALEAIDTSS